MSSVDPYLNMIIALLGLAYPILLQVIARLDERYESENIANQFKTEWEWKAFRYTLVVSLISALIWSLKLKPLIDIEKLSFIIENSAVLIVLSSTVLLVISFFFFVNKVLKYYTLYSLVPYLIGRHERSKSEIKYFPALADLLLLSIKKQQTNVCKTLSNFFYTAFKKIREKFTNEPVVYPEIYYETVYRAIEELAILKEKRNYLLEHRTSGGIWLLGEMQGKGISENTYIWLWRNLLLAIRYQQDDLIVNHWETCHQYYAYRLSHIQEEYTNSDDGYQISNQETVKKRISERHRFIEFHYAIGGLLTYKERYDCLNRLFNYTQSQPPKYELLPESMDEIFKFYSDVRDPYEHTYTFISHQYHFPEMSGLKADTLVKKWIMSYMAILFLRQYTIFPYLITMRPLKQPVIPDTQGEIKKWIDGLDFFKKSVCDHLQNQTLLKSLKLDFITPEWCIENQKPYPITFLEDFKAKLSSAYHTNAITLTISNEKVVKFENSTKTIIESTFDNLEAINNSSPIQDDNSDKWYVYGQRMLQSKDAFSENSEVDHINFDSFLASVVSKSLYHGLSETFFYKQTKSFLLKPEDFFKAIDRLKIDDKFVIVNFGIHLGYFINDLKTPELSEEKYKSIEIYSFNGSPIVRNSLFVLKRSDLPSISTKPIDDEQIQKYGLKKISDIINLHASVVDLNNAKQEVYDENRQEISDDELKKSVLMCIIISTEFRWKKDMSIIHLKKYSEYFQEGIVNKLNDVITFERE